MPTSFSITPGASALFARFETLHESLGKLRAEASVAESLALLDHISRENDTVCLSRDDLAELFGQRRAQLADARELSLSLHKDIHSLLVKGEELPC